MGGTATLGERGRKTAEPRCVGKQYLSGCHRLRSKGLCTGSPGLAEVPHRVCHRQL